MIKSFSVCSAFLLLAVSLQAQSFFYGSVYAEGMQRNRNNKPDVKFSYHFAPGRFSLSMDNFMQDSTPVLSFGIIVNVAARFTCVLDHKAKKYDSIAAVKPGSKKEQVYYRPLFIKRRILGYDCAAYINDYTQFLKGDEDSTLRNLFAAASNMIYWVADSLRIDTGAADGLADLELITVTGHLVMARQWIRAKEDTITVSEVLRISTSMPDSALFQIPAGYTRMKKGGKTFMGDPGTSESISIQDVRVEKATREPAPPPPPSPPLRKPARKPARKQ